VSPVPPRHPLCLDQPEVALIDQAGHLQGVAGPLSLHMPTRHLPQFRMDQRRDDGERLVFASIPGVEQRSNGMSHGQYPNLAFEFYARPRVRFPEPFTPLEEAALLV
jgi:hypothetical protein